MSAEVNAVLTAKDVEGLRERVKRIQALSKGDLRIFEHCRQISQTLNKGQRKVLRIEKKVTKSKPHAIMSEEIKTEVQAKEPETLQGWLDAKLKGMAGEDPVFAEKLANPKKSLQECIKFIQGEVFEKYVKGAKGESVCAMPSRDEIFGLAVHYYDEDLTIRKLPQGVQTSIKAPAPSKDELEKLKKQAEESAFKKFEAEAREKLEEREKARKKAMAEKKKAEAERKKAEEQKRGEMSLFDLFGL